MSLSCRMAAWLALAPLGLFAMAQASPALARTNHALIVASTQYVNYPERDWLNGPLNDAMLTQSYLLEHAPVKFRPDDVTVLASAPGYEQPTRDAIMTALAELARAASAGDFVYLQLAGHGSQQPALNDPSEPDGMDEIYLPMDVGKWVDMDKGAPGAITDDEIGAALDAIRAKGAFVWAVFDHCQSGTVTRAFEDDSVRDRRLDPRDLGVPEAVLAQVAAGAEATRGGPLEEAFLEPNAGTAATGGLVAFFAAQSTETTPEMALPKGVADAQIYGLFSYTLFQALATDPDMSYRQLAQSVLQTYAAMGRTRPTPLFQGDLDAPVFGSAQTARVLQWPISQDGPRLTIAGGLLHRLTPGSRVLVLPRPSSDVSEALGELEVVRAQNLSSTLRPVADAQGRTLDVAALPQGAYARLVDIDYDFELVVARPGPGSDPAALAQVERALSAIAADPAVPMQLRLVEADQPADLRLAVLTDAQVVARDARQRALVETLDETPRLWLLPDTGEISLAPAERAKAMAVPRDDGNEAFAQTLKDNLVTIFRANGLARLAAGNSFSTRDVTLDFAVERAETGALDPVAPGSAPRLAPDDLVYLTATNAFNRPVDLSVLYVGSDYSITLTYDVRLQPGDTITEPVVLINGSTAGAEKIVVVMTEAARLAASQDLSFLTQVGVREVARGGDGSLSSLLSELAGGATTRAGGMVPQSASGPKGAVLLYPVEVGLD